MPMVCAFLVGRHIEPISVIFVPIGSAAIYLGEILFIDFHAVKIPKGLISKEIAAKMKNGPQFLLLFSAQIKFIDFSCA